MQIETITVGWKETASLGNYSNVQPSLTMTARLDEHDNVDDVRWRLTQECRAFVQEAVDQALEAEGHPAKYSMDERYDVVAARVRTGAKTWRRIVVLVPTKSARRIAGVDFHGVIVGHRRHIAARRLAEERADPESDTEVLVFDCAFASITDLVAPVVVDAQRLAAAWAAEMQRQDDERRAAWQKEQADRLRAADAADNDDDDDDDDEADE